MNATFLIISHTLAKSTLSNLKGFVLGTIMILYALKQIYWRPSPMQTLQSGKENIRMESFSYTFNMIGPYDDDGEDY
jgi:hypothetical protein